MFKILESPFVTKLLCVVCCASLVVSLVAAGFGACAAFDAPTIALANAFSDDDTSPFTKDELVASALQVKHYTINDNDKAAAYACMLAINQQLKFAGNADAKAPKLDDYFDMGASELDDATLSKVDAVLAKADERYVLTPDAMSHLDDVYRVVSAAKPWLLFAVVASGVCCMAIACRAGKRCLGGVLIVAGGVVLAAFLACGVAIAVDFEGFFQLFHSLFFAAGTWEFSYDSLLICMYPENFWMGMGAIWLVVTLVCCILCLIFGKLLRRTSVAQLNV